jgi:hypothetical protein
MNVRLNSQVKDKGDSILAKAGITPTQIIRALWEKISLGMTDLRQVEEVLSLPAAATETGMVDTSKVDAMLRGRSLFAKGLERWGISEEAVTPPEARSDSELYTEALVDRLRERDLW